MKKIISLLNGIIEPISNIFGVLSFFGLSITLAKPDLKKIPLWIIVLLIISIILLIRIVIKNFKTIKNQLEDNQVKNEFEQIESQQKVQDITKALPSTKTLTRLYKKATERAKIWANDVIITQLNLYFRYSSKSWQKPNLQLRVISQWKNEEGWFYEGKLSGAESFSEPKSYSSSIPITDNDIFFLVNPNWQQLVVKSFNAVSSKLTTECSVRIQGKTIAIDFKEGKVEKSVCFVFTDNFQDVIKQ